MLITNYKALVKPRKSTIMNLFSYLFSSFLFLVALSTSVFAHDYKFGDLVIDHPHIPATVKAAPVAAGYLKIKNNGTEADKLLSISADFSAKQQIHTMMMVEGVMRMRPLKDGVEIPAGGEVVFKRGGDHFMFMKLNAQMQAGELRDVILVFEKAGEVKIGMIVIDPADLDSDAPSDDHSNHSGHTN